jgi:hypothetical protein
MLLKWSGDRPDLFAHFRDRQPDLPVPDPFKRRQPDLSLLLGGFGTPTAGSPRYHKSSKRTMPGLNT